MKLTITRKYFQIVKEVERPISSYDFWVTSTGDKIMIKNMTNSHLLNAIRFVQRNEYRYERSFYAELNKNYFQN